MNLLNAIITLQHHNSARLRAIVFVLTTSVCRLEFVYDSQPQRSIRRRVSECLLYPSWDLVLVLYHQKLCVSI